MAEMTTQTVAPVLPRAQNRVLKKFLANKSAVIGAVVVGIFVLIALLAPWLAPFDPVKANFLAVRKPPSELFWFGTDELGRDILSRIVWGGAHVADGGLYVGCDCRGDRCAVGAGGRLFPGDLGRRHFAVYRSAAGLSVPDHGDHAGRIFDPSLTNAMIAIGLSAMPIFARLTRGQTRRHSQRRVYRRGTRDWPAGSLDHHQIRAAKRDVTDSGAGYAGDCFRDYRRSQPLVPRLGSTAAKPVVGLNAQHGKRVFGTVPLDVHFSWHRYFPGGAGAF